MDPFSPAILWLVYCIAIKAPAHVAKIGVVVALALSLALNVWHRASPPESVQVDRHVHVR